MRPYSSPPHHTSSSLNWQTRQSEAPWGHRAPEATISTLQAQRDAAAASVRELQSSLAEAEASSEAAKSESAHAVTARISAEARATEARAELEAMREEHHRLQQQTQRGAHASSCTAVHAAASAVNAAPLGVNAALAGPQLDDESPLPRPSPSRRFQSRRWPSLPSEALRTTRRCLRPRT